MLTDIQNYMLAEIIKSASPNPTVLHNVAVQLHIHEPRWDELPLPPGQWNASGHFAGVLITSAMHELTIRQVDQSMRVALRGKV